MSPKKNLFKIKAGRYWREKSKIHKILQQSQSGRQYNGYQNVSSCNAERLNKSMAHTLKVNVSLRRSQLLVKSKAEWRRIRTDASKRELNCNDAGCVAECSARADEELTFACKVQERFVSQECWMY